MAFGIALIVMLALIGVFWYFTNVVIFPRTYMPENSFEQAIENNHFKREDYEALPKEEIRIQSPFGYELFGMYVPSDTPGTIHTVIIAHGITVNLCWSLKYLWIFRNRGFNVLMIEHRNHGRSGGTNTTYGYYEKYDLKAWVDCVEQRNGESCFIGSHGESMGAAITLQHAALDPRIRFVIADCPFTSVTDELAYRLKVEYHLPEKPLLPIASRVSKWRTGFAFEEASPIEAVTKIEAPVLFIHGDADDYIPPEASQHLYDAKPGPKQLWFSPGAIHAHAVLENPEAYGKQVGLFLETHKLLPDSVTANS